LKLKVFYTVDKRETNNAYEFQHLGCNAQWRTQKIIIGGFIQWQMVVICIWCALFVTSPFDVIFMSSSEVC